MGIRSGGGVEHDESRRKAGTLDRWRGLTLRSGLVIDAIGGGLFLPISLLFFLKSAHLSLTTVGAVLSVAALSSLVVPVVVGAVVDRTNPRDVVLAGQVLQGVAFLAYPVATNLAAVIAVVAVASVGQRVFWSSFFTLIAQTAAGHDAMDTDHEFAVVGMAQSAGYGVGALIAGFLLTALPRVYDALALINGVTFLVSALTLLAIPRPAKRAVERESRDNGGYGVVLRDRPFLWLIVVNTFLSLCSVWLATALPVYVESALHGVSWAVGPLLAINVGLLAVGQTTIVKLVKPLNRVRAVALSGALWTLWSVGSALAIHLPGAILFPFLLVTTLLYTVAEMIHAPIGNSLAAAAAPDASKGRHLAVFQYCYAIANVIAPVLFTSLFSVGHALPWLFVAALTALATVGTLLLESRLPARALRDAPGAG
jgi:MFS family permease